MRVHIAQIVPKGYHAAHFLHDIVEILAGCFATLGHDVSMARNVVEPNALNVILGGHLMGNPQTVTELVRGNIDYVVYQSEIINPDGVNLSGDRSQLDTVLLPLLRNARAVWDGTRSNVAALASHGVQASWLEPGFHPVLARFAPKRVQDFSFLFYGSITPHRQQVFQQLAARGRGKLHLEFDIPNPFKDDVIARSKVQLVPRQGASMNQLPYWRIVYQLHNRAVPVVERCQDQAWLEDCFLTADSEHFIDLAIATAERSDLRQLGESLHERFRARPMVNTLRPLAEAAFEAMAAGQRAGLQEVA